jgi:hypothetical protein
MKRPMRSRMRGEKGFSTFAEALLISRILELYIEYIKKSRNLSTLLLECYTSVSMVSGCCLVVP